jgi:CheY-like chemotaxis protein/HPt (histidine-containing phosphotransfer) domain-containing protein
MNAIIGMTEIALREENIDVVRRHLHTVRQAGTTLLSLINDILDLSKIESGKIKVVAGVYSFSSLLNDMVSIIRERLVDRNLHFIVNIDKNIPDALYGDELKIRQVLINLVNNAIKYTESGKISFSVSGEIADENMITLLIEVEDSGIGIKKENIDKLYDEFAQFALDYKKGVEGTGLGLAITNSLVKAMGGTIGVVSEYGSGSLFTVTLPQVIMGREKLSKVNNPENKRVLVFERREICINSIVRTMDSLGVRYTLVKSVSEFYDELTSQQYAFVFVASALYDKVREMYKEFHSNAQFVLVAEFGEVVANKNISVLTTPIFCIPVANILNGVSDAFTQTVSFAARFNAPDARILIVDDINTNLMVAEGLLLPYNMQIDLCLSGLDAIEAVLQKSYDIVFMDHMMPGMNGIEATAHIRRLGPGHAMLPIVALTANAISGTREMFLENGFDDFLSKPIDTVKLDAVLEKWIPKEKQLTHAADFGRKAPRQEGAGFAIKGVDVRAGIEMSGHMAGRYLQTLAVYSDDVHEKASEIKHSFEEGDLASYTAFMHALKGASANIGAGVVAKAAESLEMAGQQGDWEFIREHNDKFLADLKALLLNIDEAVKMHGSGGLNGFADEGELYDRLSRLKEAVVDFDVGAMNDLTLDLQAASRCVGAGNTVSEVLKCLLVGEYDEAVLLIDGLLGQRNAR